MASFQIFYTPSAQAAQAQQACLPYQGPKSLMADYFSEVQKQTKIHGSETNAKIGGIQFKNEAPQLLWAFRELVATRANQDPDPNDKVANLARNYNISRDCNKVICAADQIFGSGVGRRMIYLQSRYDLNSSKIVFENSSNFRVSELDSVILGVRQFPERLLPLERSKQLTKFLRGSTLAIYGANAPDIAANASMTFFDGWSSEAPHHRIDAVVHEIGHNLSERVYTSGVSFSVPTTVYQSLDDSPQWLAISGWNKVSERYSISPKKFVSEYARTNPAEDFAESVTHYLLYPQNLLNRHKEKYEFIKKYVFGGQEFVPGKCNQPSILSEFQNTHSKMTIEDNPERIKELTTDCVNGVYYTFDARKTFACLDFHITRQILKEHYNFDSDLVPNELINPMTRGFVVHFPHVYAQVLNYAENNPGNALYKEKMEEVRKRSLMQYAQIKLHEASDKMHEAWQALIDIINEMDAE
jgi:hypothetical protein